MLVKIRVEILADIPQKTITQEIVKLQEEYINNVLKTDVNMSIYKSAQVRSIHPIHPEVKSK